MTMGPRGEGWVGIQGVILAAILFIPDPWHLHFVPGVRITGGVLLALGIVLSIAGLVSLGRNLTPFPKPLESNHLVRRGAYRLVRHPIYSSLIFMSLGWSIFLSHLLGILFTVSLFVFFDLKSRREERWLVEAHPEYVDYRRHVKRLIPWIY